MLDPQRREGLEDRIVEHLLCGLFLFAGFETFGTGLFTGIDIGGFTDSTVWLMNEVFVASKDSVFSLAAVIAFLRLRLPLAVRVGFGTDIVLQCSLVNII